MVKNNDYILKIAEQAGLVKDPAFVINMEKAGGRGITCSIEELGQFAKIVGQLAREDERKKLSEK